MKTVKPFTNSFVREKIMQPSIFEGLNREAVLLSYALIETGCRPSELANIEPENIRLNEEIPHIRIRSRANRALKSAASVRDIPLVGVSLEALKFAPNVFPHYRDRGYLLSQTLLKAGLDFGLRCTLMGLEDL